MSKIICSLLLTHTSLLLFYRFWCYCWCCCCCFIYLTYRWLKQCNREQRLAPQLLLSNRKKNTPQRWQRKRNDLCTLYSVHQHSACLYIYIYHEHFVFMYMLIERATNEKRYDWEWDGTRATWIFRIQDTHQIQPVNQQFMR